MKGNNNTSEFIDVGLLVSSINEEYIEYIAKILKDYLLFFYVKPENVTKELLIEKTYDYIESFLIKNEKMPDKLLRMYCDDLYKKANSNIAKGSRAEQYLQKANILREKVRKEKKYSTQTISDVKDFSRICLCLISSPKNQDGKISNLDFAYDKLKITPIINMFKKGKGVFTLDDDYCYKAFSIVMMVLVHYSIKSDVSNTKEEI